jgi:hypothetical protein
MPSRTRSKTPPAASRRKRLLHALYLAQPFLQIVALMVVLFALGRCSPLSPSSDRSALNKTSADGVVATRTEHGQTSAEDEDIKREMRDVSSLEEIPLLSQSDFSSRLLTPLALTPETGADIVGVQRIFRARSARVRGAHLLVIRLLREQREAFFRSGAVRVNLAEVLASHMTPEVRQAYFTELHKLSHGNLTAKAYLELSDDDMSSPDAVAAIPVAAKIQLAIFPSDERAWLQIVRQEQRLDDQQQKLIESNKDRAVSMALVLD